MEQTQTEKLFKGFWGKGGLSDEIDKRQYENIKGLKAVIDKKTYWHFLECLPPLRFDGENFYMCEFLTGDLTLKFTIIEGVYYCEVAELKRNDDEW